jgi:hypothetical protein
MILSGNGCCYMGRMKPHAAAALAFLGWYLIPPSNNDSAALPKWEVAASYDSASACDDALRKNKEEAETEYDHPPLPPPGWKYPIKEWPVYTHWIAERFLAAQCIATNDPRLAK